jgi:hypothetical protein
LIYWHRLWAPVTARWTRPQRMAVRLLLLAALIIVAEAAWEGLAGWGWFQPLHLIFATIAVLCAVAVASQWGVLQALSLGVDVWLGILTLGQLVLNETPNYLANPRSIDTIGGRIWLAGIPVVLIAFAVAVLILIHWFIAMRVQVRPSTPAIRRSAHRRTGTGSETGFEIVPRKRK